MRSNRGDATRADRAERYCAESRIDTRNRLCRPFDRSCAGWSGDAEHVIRSPSVALLSVVIATSVTAPIAAQTATAAGGTPTSVAPSTALNGAEGRPIIVASKPFGESYLLCEMFAQLLE